MILWTIQSYDVLQQLTQDGVYHCDPSKISMPEYTDQYDWLAKRMREKIGPPPEGIVYPVWAWYLWEGKHRKPDLRYLRWNWGSGDEQFVCMEIEIPDDQIVLSDEELWHHVLGDWLISDSEAEFDELEAKYNAQPPEEQREFLRRNHERIFDVSPMDNGWTRHGKWVQATFWELRLEQVRKVQKFESVKRQKGLIK